MFTRIRSLLQLRRSTAFLLERADDRLLVDIGLTRAEMEALHRGECAAPDAPPVQNLRARSLPVAG